MKNLLMIVIAIALVGCNAKPTYFHTGQMIAKHPPPIEARLTLLPEQRYKLVLYVEANDSYETELGRWWEIEEQVLLLLPDDPNKKQRFAHAREEPISIDFRTLWLFDDLRPAMAEPKPLYAGLGEIEIESVSDRGDIDTIQDQTQSLGIRKDK